MSILSLVKTKDLTTCLEDDPFRDIGYEGKMLAHSPEQVRRGIKRAAASMASDVKTAGLWRTGPDSMDRGWAKPACIIWGAGSTGAGLAPTSRLAERNPFRYSGRSRRTAPKNHLRVVQPGISRST